MSQQVNGGIALTLTNKREALSLVIGWLAEG